MQTMESSADPLIRLDSVSFGFDERTLFSDLSGTIGAGEIIVVRGPSGSGKSSLLRLLCRLEEPTSGRLRYKATPYDEWDPPRLRREIAYVQQSPTVVPATVRENLLVPFGFAVNADLDRPTDAELTERLADFRLDDAPLSQAAATLSVGQRQRLCLVRTFLLRPRVLLMDEPTSALDDESAELVLAGAQAYSRETGAPLVVILHGERLDRFPEARTWRLESGAVIEQGEET
jgi:putative ABC transport system ATP-binding protein